MTFSQHAWIRRSASLGLLLLMLLLSLALHSVAQAANAVPFANDDLFIFNEDTLFNVVVPGVLGNDIDPDLDTLSAQLVSSPNHGSLTLNADGSFSYQPAQDYCGYDNFTYTAFDGADVSNNANVILIIQCLNDPPVAEPFSTTTNEDISVSGQLTAMDVDGNSLIYGVSTLPAHGSLTEWNPFTGEFTYQPAADFNGNDSFTFLVSDGSQNSNVATVNITVNPVNDAPVFMVGANQTVSEDAGAQTVAAWATSISAGPANESSQVLSFIISANTNPGLFASGPSVAADGTLSYTPAADANGSATITLYLMDNGGTANGGIDRTTTKTFTITVNPVNDAPVFTVGANQTVNEDAGAQTVAAWATSISAGPANESGQALVFVISANTNPGLFASGPSVAANGTLTYTPAADAHGSATITLYLMDNGGTANGGVDRTTTKTFTITINPVNDAPSFTVGANQTVNEDASAQTVAAWATNMSAGPTDEASQTLAFVVSANTNPGLFASGPAIAANGTLTYTPAANANGSATIAVYVQDNGGRANGGVDQSAAQSFTITINPVNDAPVFTVGANQTVNEDAGAQTVAAWATSISAGPANESGQALAFVISANTNPGLFASGPSVAANGTLTYTPAADAHGSATITLYLMDNGGTANGGVDQSAAQSFTVTVNAVNDPPVNSMPSAQTTNEDTALVFNGANNNVITVSDVDAGSSATISMALSVTHGTLTLGSTTGLAFSSGDGMTDTQMMFSATLASINAALSGLTYIPVTDYNGTAILSVSSDDLGQTGSGTLHSTTNTLTITVNAVNDVPSFSIGADQVVDEDSGTHTVTGWATSISAGPANESAQTLTFVISGNSDPSLFASGPAVAADGTLAYTLAADANGNATITLYLVDNGGTANGGVDRSVTQSFTITINGLNDAPINSVPSGQTTNEDTALVFSNANGNQISVSDIDTGNDNLYIALSVTNGSLTLGSTTGLEFIFGDGTDDSQITFTGKTAALNAALAQVTYTPALDYNGTAILTIDTNDLGHNGNGGALNDRDTVAITLNAINDAPVIDLPVAQTTDEDTALVFNAAHSNLINITDVDAGSSPIQVALGVANGTLTLSGTQGLTFSEGSGTADPSMTFTGTLANIAKALTGLVYTPALNDNGTTILTIAVDDLGNSGSGGARNVTASLNIIIHAINDLPTISAIVDQVTGEDIPTSALPFEINDIETSAENLTMSASSSDTTLVPNANITFAGTGANRTAMVTPAVDQYGVATLTLSVSDGVDIVSTSFKLTVTPINDAPTLDAIANMNLLEDAATQTVNLSGVSSGPTNESAQTLVLSVRSSNTLVIPTPTLHYTSGSSSATLNFTPVMNANGIVTITIQLKDNGGTDNGGVDTLQRTFTVEVTAVNDAPTLNALSNITLLENAAQQEVILRGIGAGTANESAQQLTITATSSNPALLADPTVSYSSGAITATLQFTPLPYANGTAVVTVYVSDDGGTLNGGVDTMARSFTITVLAVNQPPTFDQPRAQTILEDAGTQSVTLTGIDAGSPPEAGQTLTVTAHTNSPLQIGNVLVDYTNGSSTAILRFRPLADANGAATITIRVEDDGGTANGGSDWVEHTLTVQITPVNDAPDFTPVSTITASAQAGSQVIANWVQDFAAGPANESDQVAFGYSVVAVSNPALFSVAPTIDSAGRLRYTPRPGTDGSAVISVIVQDNGGSANGGVDTSAVKTFTITITRLAYLYLPLIK